MTSLSPVLDAWVLRGDLHFQMTEVASSVPFGYVQLRCVRREAHHGFFVESDHINDERISLPASDGMSLPREGIANWGFKRWLAKQGCTFESGRGGHLAVRRGDKVSTLPMHGKGKELGTGLVNAIKKQLGLTG